jgi:hypothetical protein
MSYYNTRRRARINRHYRDHIVRRLIDVTGYLIGMTIVALFFSFILINWVSGCGERFATADGGYIQGECISPLDLFRDEPRTEENN